MNKSKIFIGEDEVEYEQLVKFILAQKKIQAIHFLKTKNQLDLRDAKKVVESIRSGQLEEAFNILKNQLGCGSPILEKGGEVDYSHASHKNPFLVEKEGSKSKSLLLLALFLLGLGIVIALYFSM